MFFFSVSCRGFVSFLTVVSDRPHLFRDKVTVAMDSISGMSNLVVIIMLKFRCKHEHSSFLFRSTSTGMGNVDL